MAHERQSANSRCSRSLARSTILNSKFSRYSAATGGKIGSAVKIISGWLNNNCSVAAAPRASAMTVLPARAVCDGSDCSQLQKVVGNHDLRCRKFLCTVSHYRAPPLVYKSSARIPSKIHYHTSVSPFKRTRYSQSISH